MEYFLIEYLKITKNITINIINWPFILSYGLRVSNIDKHYFVVVFELIKYLINNKRVIKISKKRNRGVKCFS